MTVARAVLYAVLGLGLVVGSPTIGQAQQAKRAKVVRCEQIHNQSQNGQKGMIIQMDLEVDGFKDREVNIAAFFQWSDGKVLTAKDGKYKAPNNQLTTQRKQIPKFDTTDFKNFELFIPYDEVSLGVQGNYKLRYNVEVQFYDGAAWSALTVSDYYYFNLKQD